MNKRIIFLDYDGVMLTPESYKSCRFPNIIPPLRCIAQLNRLIEETDARIVVSSSWRIGSTVEELKRQIESWGIKTGVVLDRTGPCCKTRGEEISNWLKVNSTVRFVILDDCTDMDDLNKFLVRTKWKTGLNQSNVDEAIKILNGDS